MHSFITHYKTVSLPKLKEVKNYTSEFMVPRITKVSINCGMGDVLGNGKAVEDVTKLLTAITGQKPIETKARKAISGFKIRQGMVVAQKVTLRGERMYDFLSKFIQIALPRTRDFRGLKASGITADGNLNVGIKDSMIFTEAPQEGMTHGVQVTIVSTARTLEEARLLYESIGFVFQSQDEEIAKKKTGKHYQKRKK